MQDPAEALLQTAVSQIFLAVQDEVSEYVHGVQLEDCLAEQYWVCPPTN
jgi:hypothetical protein